MNCSHPSVQCINPYELIRKYRCDACGEVMMCACEEEFALRFFPHQSYEGTELNTRKPVPVTLGFQGGICNTCRGLPEKAYPKAEIYGHTTKIRRYYWREIMFETLRLFYDWAESEGYDDWLTARREHDEKYKEFEKLALKHIKDLHRTSPRYIYQEKSQSEVLEENDVEVVDLDGTYVETPERGVAILDGNDAYSAEEFVTRYYERQGYQSLFVESRPFHALFGILMWIVIQDPTDDHGQIVSFGERSAYEAGNQGESVFTVLPRDFGTSGYFERRRDEVEEHLKSLAASKKDLLSLFDYWTTHSYELRQYLWAHRDEDVMRARQIVEILPLAVVKTVLRYLTEDYWRHYVGWPDLLLYREEEFFFAEVKSSGDKLSEDQKSWIEDNTQRLGLPFRVVKIHRTKQLDEIPGSNQ